MFASFIVSYTSVWWNLCLCLSVCLSQCMYWLAMRKLS